MDGDFIPIDQLESQSSSSNDGFIPIDQLDQKNTQTPNKPFYEAIGASMTPQENAAHPVIGTAEKMLQNVATGGEKIINGLSFGQVENQLRKNHIEPPQLNVGDPSNQGAANLIEDTSNLVGNISNPFVNTAIGKVTEVGVKAIESAVPKIKQFTDNIIHGPEKVATQADADKFALQQQTDKQIADTQRIGKAKINIAQKNADAVSQGYDDLSTTMKDKVDNLSREEGKNIQNDLPKIFGQRSKEYGTAQKNIIDSLSTEERSIPTKQISSDMENTLKKFRIIGKDNQGNTLLTDAELTPNEKKVIGIYKEIKNNPSIDIEDLMKNQDFIKPDYGKPFEPDDKLRSEIAQIFSKHVENAAPELQALKSKYAPFLEWKNAAIDKLKPFNSTYDVATGTLSKSGSADISGNEQELMAKLQKIYQSPYGAKINALNKGIKTTMLNKEQATQTSKEVIQNLRNSLAKDLQKIRQTKNISSRNIDSQANALISKYRNQRLATQIGLGAVGLGGGGKIVETFIKNFVKNN